MNEQELLVKLKKVRQVPPNTWSYLVDKGYVEAGVEEEGAALGRPVEYLVEAFDELTDAAPVRMRSTRPPGRMGSGERIPAQLSDYEIERSELFSEYLARQAAPDVVVRHSTDGPLRVYPEVKGFRVKHLDDKVLSPEQARALLTSPVAAYWPHLAFHEFGVPVVGHAYQAMEGMSDERGPYSLIEVSLPSSEDKSFKDRRPLEPGPWEIPDEPENARSNQKPKRELETPAGSWKILTFPGEDGYPHRVLARPRSVLGDLHNKVSRLVKRYPWEELDAVWFVLTGKTPWVAPLTWQFRGTGSPLDSWSYGYITLKVEPWVSASVVARVYSDLQHQLLGKDNKRVGEKNRELFRFVISRMTSDGSLPKARELVKEWDRANPQWRYGHEDTEQVRRFRRDYNLARRLLAAPSYELREE